MKTDNKIKKILSEIFISLYLITSVIPGFYLIGSLSLQTLVTVLYVGIFLIFTDRLKIKPIVFSRAITFMLFFWTALAVAIQIKIHIANNDSSPVWYHIFYYDKMALLYVTAFTVWAYFIIKLILNINDNGFIQSYKAFSKNILCSLLIFYFLTITYCFIICRSPGTEREPANWIPFTVIKNTFMIGRLDYELVFLFLGNIAIFAPLGIFLDMVLNKKYYWVLIITPIILSTGIELSQYYLKLGNCDVDDIILNVLGFYIGIVIKRLLDKLVFTISKGRISTI